METGNHRMEHAVEGDFSRWRPVHIEPRIQRISWNGASRIPIASLRSKYEGRRRVGPRFQRGGTDRWREIPFRVQRRPH